MDAQFSETEQKILHAAKEVFLRHGKDGARMQEIARLAGINQALLHYYFRNKDTLFTTVARHLIRDFLQHIFIDTHEEASLQDFLQKFVSNYIDYIAENLELPRFILWEIERGGDIMVQEVRALQQQHGFGILPLQQRIAEAIHNREIRAVDPLHLILSIIGMCIYPYVARPVAEKIFQLPDITSRTFRDQRKQEVFQILWNGIKYTPSD
ncbi:MAG: TetR/AcrR family transcriptional regulator [candidate division KSB1 bacterium]|nr:TetR/AcrR family transcriptional regulator [candidate division KSB1 bacterium]